MEVMDSVEILQSKVDVDGICLDRFRRVRDAFHHLLGTGQDIGASVAVFIDGEPVVDLWGGCFDQTYTRPFERDTICQTYSSTKTVTALCALVLADRGGIDLDAPVRTYWPEFAAEGKADIVVRQLLGHTAGLCGWVEPMTFRAIYDQERASAMLARQAPLWKPGRTSGYHGYTQGHLVGEVIRRVTGQSLGQFLASEITGPLGVGADYYIGTPAECDRRVAALIQGSPIDTANGNRYHDLALHNPYPSPAHTSTLAWRRAELGGMNGHGNARGLAVMHSILASGTVRGRRFMSDSGRARVLEPQSDGADLVIGAACRWGMGFALETRPISGAFAGPRAACWGGNGGSMAFIDLDHGMAFGFVPNRWISGPHETVRARTLIEATYASLNNN